MPLYCPFRHQWMSEVMKANNEIKQHTKLNFTEIAELIETHYRYLLQNQIHLLKDLSREEMGDFLANIFGIRNFNYESSKEVYMSRIQTALRRALFQYKLMTKFAKSDNRKVGISLLYMTITEEIKTNSESKKILRKLKKGGTQIVSLEQIFYLSFQDRPFLDTIYASLQTLLPENYSILTKFIMASEDSPTLLTHLINWSVIIEDFEQNIINIEFPPSNINNTASIPAPIIQTVTQAKAFVKTNVDNLIKALKARVDERAQFHGAVNKTFARKYDTKTELTDRESDAFGQEYYKNLSDMMDSFYNIYADYLPLCKQYIEQKNFIINLEKSVQVYYETMLRIEEAEDSLINHYYEVSKRIAKIADSDEVQVLINFSERILPILDQIKEIAQLLRNTSLDPTITIEEIRNIETTFLKVNTEVTFQLEKLDLELDSYFSNLQQKIKEDKNKRKIEREEALITAHEKERAEFLSNTAEALKAYKDTVLRRREEKKQVAQIILPVQPTTLEREIVTYKDEAVGELIEKLSPNKFKLLESILKSEQGINYDKVISLIKNHLNGKVMEVGNGSALKRIKLNNYLIQISSQDTEDTLERYKSKPSLSTVGIFMPYGKKHSPKLLWGFNSKLLQRAFISAGITMELLETIKLKKEAGISPANAIGSPS